MTSDPTETDPSAGQPDRRAAPAPRDFVSFWTRVEIARAMREARDSLACLAERQRQKDGERSA